MRLPLCGRTGQVYRVLLRADDDDGDGDGDDEKKRGSTTVCAPLVLMREAENTPKMRSAISSAIILDSELNVTAGQYLFSISEHTTWVKGLTP
jgi:hypothetical protein